MGNTLPRLSLEWLPMPSDEDLPKFEALGFQFNQDNRDRDMVNVSKFPTETHALYISSDRGDITYAKIVRLDGELQASLVWRSKGAYDNDATMKFQTIDVTKKRWKLNMAAVTNEDGVLVETPSKEALFVNLLNDYYENEFRGLYQADLDKQYKEIQTKLKEFADPEAIMKKYPFKRLVSHRDPHAANITDFIHAVKTTETVFSKPFLYDDPSILYEVQPCEG